MNVNRETKVQEIVTAHPEATRVLEDAGVDYCCGGHHSLQDACERANVSTEQILERLRENQAKVEPAAADWVSAPLHEITQQVREKHHRYVRQAIPRVVGLLARVKAKHGERHPEIAKIEGLFLAVGQEMIAHMQKEEQILFPYIEKIERAAQAHEALEPPFFQTVKNPVRHMMQDHDVAGNQVKQIRRASSEYTPPADACRSYQALYRELRDFEADLHQHVHLENNILFPRAVEMEDAGK